MKLSLKNIGKIGAASIEINGITVIAGENNTGKSTVGKALYSLFCAFYKISDKIREERTESIFRYFTSGVWSVPTKVTVGRVRKLVEDICADRDRYIDNPNELKRTLEKLFESQDIRDIFFHNLDKSSMEAVFNKVLSYLKLDDDSIKAYVFKKILLSEFRMQIGHFNSKVPNSALALEIHGNTDFEIEIYNDEYVNIKNSIEINSNLAYIEDPFVINELTDEAFYLSEYAESHRLKLKELLIYKGDRSLVGSVMEEMAVSEKLNHILDILNGICEGKLAATEDSYAYTAAELEKPLALSNVSTGLKTFLIIKTLLSNGSIEEGGTIILDEPEIHLHPEWQLLLAEIIVLVQKEFGVHVLLNTHSPYFLNAIEVYAAKYGVDDKCKYYLSACENGIARIDDVTDNIEAIYNKLARPLHLLYCQGSKRTDSF